MLDELLDELIGEAKELGRNQDFAQLTNVALKIYDRALELQAIPQGKKLAHPGKTDPNLNIRDCLIEEWPTLDQVVVLDPRGTVIGWAYEIGSDWMIHADPVFTGIVPKNEIQNVQRSYYLGA